MENDFQTNNINIAKEYNSLKDQITLGEEYIRKTEALFRPQNIYDSNWTSSA